VDNTRSCVVSWGFFEGCVKRGVGNLVWFSARSPQL